MLTKEARKSRTKRRIALGVNILFGVMIVSRFTIVITLVFWLVATKAEWRHKARSRLLFIFPSIIVMALLFFNYFFSIRNELSIEDYAFFQDISFGSNDTGIFNILKLPYMYLSSPISNFAYTIDNCHDYSYGLLTLGPIVRLLQLDVLLPSLLVYREVFNTNMFLSVYFMDFGLIGCILIPFLIGRIIRNLQALSESSEHELLLGTYIYWMCALLLSFFSNHFSSVGYPILYPIIYMAMVGWIVKSSKG